MRGMHSLILPSQLVRALGWRYHDNIEAYLTDNHCLLLRKVRLDRVPGSGDEPLGEHEVILHDE